MQVDGFQLVMMVLGALITALMSILTFVGLEIKKKVSLINGLVQEHTVEISKLGFLGGRHTDELKVVSEATKKLAVEMNRFDVRAASRHSD